MRSGGKFGDNFKELPITINEWSGSLLGHTGHGAGGAVLGRPPAGTGPAISAEDRGTHEILPLGLCGVPAVRHGAGGPGAPAAVLRGLEPGAEQQHLAIRSVRGADGRYL